jgi:hypothetical protein
MKYEGAARSSQPIGHGGLTPRSEYKSQERWVPIQSPARRGLVTPFTVTADHPSLTTLALRLRHPIKSFPHDCILQHSNRLPTQSSTLVSGASK